MSTLDDYTLVIPTYNRPGLLDALLTHLEAGQASFPIRILDSSTQENRERNRKVVSSHRLNIQHLDFDETIGLLGKLNGGLATITSRYVSICGDDDLVFVDAIAASLAVLETRPECVACHGMYLNFSLAEQVVSLRVEYSSPSIEGSDAMGRVYQLLARYESMFYAVYRREQLAEVLLLSDRPNASPYWRMFLWELFSAALVAGNGSVKRLTQVSHARRAYPDIPQTRWHPASLICDDPDGLMAEFVQYRRFLIDCLTSKGIDLGPEPERRLTLAHLRYFVNELGDGSFVKRRVAEHFSVPMAETQAAEASTPQRGWLVDHVIHPPLNALRMLKRKLFEPKDQTFRAADNGMVFTAPASLRGVVSGKVITELSDYCRGLTAHAV